MKSPAPSRGDQTRESLVRAATRIIGKTGFDAASTRAIAEEAGVNVALINYHFGGKDGLYQAVIGGISAQMETSLVPALDQLSAAMPLQGRAAADGILTLSTAIINQFGLAEMQDWARIITREQQDPTPAFEIIYERFMSRVLTVLSSLITGASGGLVKGKAARMRATFFIGQILMFIYAPAATQRFLGWSTLEEKHRKALLRELQHIVYSQFSGEIQ